MQKSFILQHTKNVDTNKYMAYITPKLNKLVYDINLF